MLALVPKTKRPSIDVPKYAIIGAACVFPLLMLVRIISLTSTLHRQFSLSWLEAFTTVVTTYTVGQAFLFSLFLSVILLISHRLRIEGAQRQLKWLRFALVIALLGAASWASHSAAIDGLRGFFANMLHLAAVSVWIGVLFVVSWFSTESKHQAAFQRWFSPLAGLSVAAIIVSGFMLMGQIVPEYVNAWLLTYGQLLLLKHLLFLPLLLFGFRHLFLLRKQASLLTGRRLLRSFKIESVLAIAILLVSAIMTEQTPPHEVLQTLQTEETVPIIHLFLSEPLQEGQALSFSPGLSAIALMLVAIGLFSISLRWLLRRTHAGKPLALASLALAFGYSSLMLAVEPSSYAIDDTIYSTVEEAISVPYSQDTDIELLLAAEEGGVMQVVYMTNETELVAEKLAIASGSTGYQRLPAAMLTIGGTAITSENQKIRTFRVESGYWHNEDFNYTYVTFGRIVEPEAAARVHIHYEGASHIAELENHVFLKAVSSEEQWGAEHPIDILAADGTVLDVYARDVIEEGVYCH